ncbi:MAG: sortase [Actinomycetota bacterium]
MPRIDPANDADEPGGAAPAAPDPTPAEGIAVLAAPRDAEDTPVPAPAEGVALLAAPEELPGDEERTPLPIAPVPAAAPTGGQPPRRTHRKLVAGLLISLSILLILGAAGVGGYPYYTDLMAGRRQKTLAADFHKTTQATGNARTALIQQWESRDFTTGEGITKIVIPAINVNEIVVEGTTDAALDVGAGHYTMTPMPGQVGNVAIAGHRTMNGHPFGDLNKLHPGDQIILQTPFDTYTYSVLAPFDGHANPWVVQPDDWSVIEFPTAQSLLTLTTCNPPGQQTNRLVARASLVGTQPA